MWIAGRPVSEIQYRCRGVRVEVESEIRPVSVRLGVAPRLTFETRRKRLLHPLADVERELELTYCFSSLSAFWSR